MKYLLPELTLILAVTSPAIVSAADLIITEAQIYTGNDSQPEAQAVVVTDGKIVFVMEGGYDLPALAHGMRNIAHILLEEDEISEFYGAASGKDPDIEPMIEQLQQIHGL